MRIARHAAAEEFVGSPANRVFVDRDQRGQVIGSFARLDGSTLREVLESHGFPSDAADHLRSDDRMELLRSRRERLIDEERQLLQDRRVTVSQERVGDTVRDSDVSDEE